RSTSSLRRRSQWIFLCSITLFLNSIIGTEVMATASVGLRIGPQLDALPRSASQQSNSNNQTKGEPDVRALEVGKSIERTLTGGESHAYRITLAASQFLH